MASALIVDITSGVSFFVSDSSRVKNSYKPKLYCFRYSKLRTLYVALGACSFHVPFSTEYDKQHNTILACLDIDTPAGAYSVHREI